MDFVVRYSCWYNNSVDYSNLCYYCNILYWHNQVI
nr:MAG TPA_asm: conotoxin [Caudoviricetes sp.]